MTVPCALILPVERLKSFVRITENSMVPGHYMDFFDKVRKHGLREGLRRQRENYGTTDPVMEGEMNRLKAKKAS